jgi:predicted amidohydrolase
MKVFCCQINCAWENKPANYKRVRSLLQNARIPKGSLVVLPEMFATGFSMNVEATREGASPETDLFVRQAAVDNEAFIIAGVVGTGPDGRARNQALVFSTTGQPLARYTKIHPFTLGGEAACYAAGTEIVTFDWNGCTTAPLVCYDLRFPEVFRSAVARGTQLYAVIANWPVKREMHWVTLLQARAIENQAYVVGVNRCGADPKHTYSGRSMVIDPHGKILAEIGNEEGVIGADVDLAALEAWRKDFPALGDIHWTG